MATPESDLPGEHLYADAPRSMAGAMAIAALQSLSQSARTADELALHRVGVGPLDARALLYLVQRHRHGLVVRPSDLVAMLHVTSAAITKLVDRLVHSGRVDRHPDPRDRRAVVLTPTERTESELAEAYGHIHEPLVSVVDEFSEEELAIIDRFATRLAGAFRAESATADPPPPAAG